MLSISIEFCDLVNLKQFWKLDLTSDIFLIIFVSQFFTSLPLPCDPSSLPKYPPSKEFDAKLRDEEARR